MKKFLFYMTFAVGITSHIHAQSLIKGCPKVFLNSLEVCDSFCDTNIKNVRNAVFKEHLIIKYRDRTQKIVSLDSIWGFREKSEYPYRIYKANPYVLYAFEPVYKYRRKTGKITHYYFSTSLDSAIYPYTPDQLKQHADSAVYAAIVKDAETNRHEMSDDFYMLNTRILDRNVWGGGFEIKYSPVNKWSTGISFGMASSHTTDTFSFSIKDPLVTYMEFGWLNQFNIVTRRKFRASVNLINGLAIGELLDNGEKVRTRTRYGYRNMAKGLATNYYYLLEPGIDLSIRLISNRHFPDLYLTNKVKYKYVFGSSNFASTNKFKGLLVALGISVIGFDKMQF